MKHKQVIEEIRSMLDTFENLEPRIISDEELEDYVYLSPKDCYLSCGILLDSNKSYEKFDHPVWLYVTYGDEKVYPVTIDSVPRMSKDVTNKEEIMDFIINNLQALLAYANRMIDSFDFYDAIDDSHEKSYSMVNEMGTIAPDKTGLPIYVWIDETQAYKKCGHSNSYRFKFQQDKNIGDTNKWMPVTVPDLKVRWDGEYPPCKEPIWKVNKVLQWGKLNTEALLLLKDGKISGIEFKIKYHKRVDGVEVVNEKNYVISGEAGFGLLLVKNDEKKYNFINKEQELLLPEWFDKVGHIFMQIDTDDIRATVKYGEKWYNVTLDGKLTELTF